jgi:hypothetical protein
LKKTQQQQYISQMQSAQSQMQQGANTAYQQLQNLNAGQQQNDLSAITRQFDAANALGKAKVGETAPQMGSPVPSTAPSQIQSPVRGSALPTNQLQSGGNQFQLPNTTKVFGGS